MKTVYLLLSLLLSFQVQANSVVEMSDLIKKLEESTGRNSKAAIEYVQSGPDMFNKKQFKEFLETKDDEHVLDFYKILGFDFEEMTEKINNIFAYPYENEREELEAALYNLETIDEIESILSAEVGRRVWTDYSYDYYFVLNLSDGHVLFKVNDIQ